MGTQFKSIWMVLYKPLKLYSNKWLNIYLEIPFYWCSTLSSLVLGQFAVIRKTFINVFFVENEVTMFFKVFRFIILTWLRTWKVDLHNWLIFILWHVIENSDFIKKMRMDKFRESIKCSIFYKSYILKQPDYISICNNKDDKWVK